MNFNLLSLIQKWFNLKYKKPHQSNLIDYFSLVDKGITATWDLKTGQDIQRKMKAAREGLLSEIEAMEFLNLLDDVSQRKFNDQTINSIKYDGFIPLNSSYKYDKITSYGLSLMCALIVQKNVAPITNMAAGEGSGDTEDYQDLLINERCRNLFAESGYINSLNKTMRFNMTFDILEPTFNVREIGLFNVDDDNLGPMISRTIFVPAVEHIYQENYFTASYLITTLSS